MGYVGNSPAEKYASFAVQHFTTSATTGYTLDHAVTNENDIRLVINNVIQQPGSSYAYTASGTTLTLSAATAGTDTMYCVFLGKAVHTVVPHAGSVTESTIGASNSPTNGYVLSAQSGAAGGLTWAADAAGTITAFTNGVDNRLVTATSATALNGEADLTYDGTTFQLSQASPIFKVLPTTNGNSGVVEICGRATDGSPTENRTQIKGTPEGSTANTEMTFHVENASGVNERMAINSGGDVKIHSRAIIGDDGDGTYGLNIVRGGNAGENGVYFNDKDGQTSYEFFTFRRQGTQIGHIRRDGTNDSINYTTSSDYRLKDGIVDKTDGIEKLKQLKPKKFYWKSNANKTLVDGFLAHEVSSIVPESISGEKDEIEKNKDGTNKLDDEGNTIPRYQGIDQSKLVPLLTSALKEAITKIETLETRVKTLDDA